jgi:hypothetical protein
MSIERGWKSIEKYTQMSRKSVVELYEIENFPMAKIKGLWTIQTSQVDVWFENHIGNNLTVSHSTRVK